MRTALLAMLLILASLAALWASCGGDSDEPRTGPANVIAFGAREAEGDGRHGLYIVAPDGSSLHRLAEEDGFIFFPRWSPAGDRIAYIVGTEGEESAGELVVYDFPTETRTVVPHQATTSLLGPGVAWSPDGRQLVFSDEDAELRTYDLEDEELMLAPDVRALEPDWSPDGSELAFAQRTTPGSDVPWPAGLHLMDSGGGDVRELTEPSGTSGNPRWAPDGSRLAFWSAPQDQMDARSVIIVDRQGGLVTNVGSGYAAAWSPDGASLAYSGSPAAGNPADLDVFLATLDGEQPRALSKAVTLDLWPSWSPDGRRLVYLAQADLQTSFLCVVEIEHASDDCLELPDGLVPTAPAWSPR